jgi:hypothetical protein
MDLVLRQEFHSMIAKLADKYQLHDIVYASFNLQYGFRSRYCAADVVYAMLATLESMASCFFMLFYTVIPSADRIINKLGWECQSGWIQDTIFSEPQNGCLS